jgi:hypothetical protein
MRLAALVIVALALSTTPGLAGARGEEPTTRLTIVALDSYVGRAVFHLSCEPVGGDLPDATTACAALDQKPELITDPEPFTCRGGPGSWWLVKVAGSLHSDAISRTFATCWTLQAPTLAQLGLTWDVLRSHLVPRRHKRVPAGTTRRFAPGVLRETDLVTCDIRGYHLKVGVPEEPGRPVSVSAGTHPVVTLTVAYNRDRSVTASCRRGKR